MASEISVMQAITNNRIPKSLVKIAAKEGVADTVEELVALLKKAVPNGHRFYNRRSGDVLFRINKGTLCDVRIIRCNHCEDNKRIAFYEDCEKCEGAGCELCKRGVVRVYRECPECAVTPLKLTASGNRR